MQLLLMSVNETRLKGVAPGLALAEQVLGAATSPGSGAGVWPLGTSVSTSVPTLAHGPGAKGAKGLGAAPFVPSPPGVTASQSAGSEWAGRCCQQL